MANGDSIDFEDSAQGYRLPASAKTATADPGPALPTWFREAKPSDLPPSAAAAPPAAEAPPPLDPVALPSPIRDVLQRWGAIPNKDPTAELADYNQTVKTNAANVIDAKTAQVLPKSAEVTTPPYANGDAIPSTPRSQMRNALMPFANPLMWLAIGGSLMTRRPAINAFTAAGALMQGQNDVALAKLNMQKFKHAVGQVDKQAAYELGQYKEIWNSSLPMADKVAQMSALATSFDDKNMLAALQSNNFKRVDDLFGVREKSLEYMHRAHSSYDKTTAKQEAAEQRSIAQAQKPDPLYEDQAQAFAKCGGEPSCEKNVLQGFDAKTRDRVIARGNAISRGFSPEEKQRLKETGGMTPNQQSIMEGIIKGDRPPTTQGLGVANRAPIEAGLERSGFNLQAAQLKQAALQAQVRSLNSPQTNRLRTLIERAIPLIDRTNELAKQMDQGGIGLLNEARLQAYIKGAGNSRMGQIATQYLSDINTLKETFAGIVQSGYSPTEPAFALANAQINAGYGAAQLAASLQEVRRDMKYSYDAIVNLRPIVPGQPPPPFGSTSGQDAAAGGAAGPSGKTKSGVPWSVQ